MIGGEDLVAIARVGALLRAAETEQIDFAGGFWNCTQAAERLKEGMTMTPDDVISVFEQLNREGRAVVDLDHACASFAKWLASAWDDLGATDVALLTSVGAALWREGYARRY